MIKKMKTEDKVLILFYWYEFLLLMTAIIQESFSPGIKLIESFLASCLFPFITVLFIIGAFFVNEKNSKIYRIACIMLIPLRLIFGETGFITLTYIRDINYLLSEEGKSFQYYLENSDAYIVFIILSYLFSAVFSSVILIYLTDHKVSEKAGISEYKYDKTFIKSAVLYALFAYADQLYFYLVRVDIESFNDKLLVLLIVMPKVFLLIFILCTIITKNLKLVSVLKYAFITVTLTTGIANTVRVLIINFGYTGMNYTFICNLLTCIYAVLFGFVITNVGEIYFLDKMHKKESVLL